MLPDMFTLDDKIARHLVLNLALAPAVESAMGIGNQMKTIHLWMVVFENCNMKHYFTKQLIHGLSKKWPLSMQQDLENQVTIHKRYVDGKLDEKEALFKAMKKYCEKESRDLICLGEKQELTVPVALNMEGEPEEGKLPEKQPRSKKCKLPGCSRYKRK